MCKDYYITSEAEAAALLNEIKKELARLRSSGVRGVRVTIKKASPPKSWTQLKIFHGFIVERFVDAAADTGETVSAEATKETLKQRFLLRPIIEPDGSPMIDEGSGESLFYLPSLSELTVAEMSEFIENCIILYFERYGNDIAAPINRN